MDKTQLTAFHCQSANSREERRKKNPEVYKRLKIWIAACFRVFGHKGIPEVPPGIGFSRRKLRLTTLALFLIVICPCFIVVTNAQEIKKPEINFPMPRPGLVGYWKFDEAGGSTVMDYSGNDNQGTIYKALFAAGKIGQGVRFNGEDSYVKIDYAPSLNLKDTFTVALWFKSEESSSGILVSKGAYCSDPRAWALGISTELTLPCPKMSLAVTAGHGSRCENMYTTAGVTIQSVKFSDAWHHLVLKCQGTKLSYYKDGQCVGRENLIQPPCQNQQGLVLGHHWCLNEHYPQTSLEGVIDEVRLYNRALSEKEILNIYYTDELSSRNLTKRDLFPPTKPVVNSIKALPNCVTLGWKAAKDDVAVKGYQIIRNGSAIDTLPASGDTVETYADIHGVSPGKRYHYKVIAYDFTDKTSTSNLIPVTTPFLHMRPVFPGAEGFGVATSAGRGGKIYRVASADSSGAAQLVQCLEASGPRICVFETSGTIDLGKYLHDHRFSIQFIVRNPFLTIAGQTAPSPGVTIKGCIFRISTHDVLIQHVRFRADTNYVGTGPGQIDGSSHDALGITGEESGALEVYNVVVDHCSISWALDENVDIFYPGVHELTISNCIVSEGLHNSGKHPKGPHSKGMIIGVNTSNVAVLSNLFAHNDQRNPVIQAFTNTIIANNVVYNPGDYGITVSNSYEEPQFQGPMNSTIASNIVIPGPSSKCANSAVMIAGDLHEQSRIFVLDNRCVNRTYVNQSPIFQPQDPWAYVLNFKGPVIKSSVPPYWVSPLRIEPSATINVEQDFLKHVGARPSDRDQVDKRIVTDVINRTGRIIDHVTDVGGWPSLPEKRRTLESLVRELGPAVGITLPKNPGGDDDGDGKTNLDELLEADRDKDGYTNLEELLHLAAARLESQR